MTTTISLEEAALERVRDAQLGAAVNPDDHDYFHWMGQRYMVQQNRPEHYTIYDMHGQRVQDLVDGPMESFGKLAFEYCNRRLPLQVLRSQRGYYIGTFSDEGPCSRESCEYFKSEQLAEKALASGDWTQRTEP